MRLWDQGFEYFLPKHRKTVRNPRKLVVRDAAFFPGYIFVALDLNRDRWRSVNGTIGVKSLIMRGEVPLPVPQGIVERLQAMTDERDYLRFDGGPDLCVGEDVRIMDGPFADMMGRIGRLDGRHRVQVLIDMIHGRVPVNLERGSVARTMGCGEDS